MCVYKQSTDLYSDLFKASPHCERLHSDRLHSFSWGVKILNETTCFSQISNSFVKLLLLRELLHFHFTLEVESKKKIIVGIFWWINATSRLFKAPTSLDSLCCLFTSIAQRTRLLKGRMRHCSPSSSSDYLYQCLFNCVEQDRWMDGWSQSGCCDAQVHQRTFL